MKHVRKIQLQKLIINHIKNPDLLPQSFPITKSLLKSVQSYQQHYEQYLREREQYKCQNEKTKQLKIIDEEIGELRGAISYNTKISKKLNEEFLKLIDEAEKQRDLLKTKELLSKGNDLKRKSQVRGGQET